MPSRSPSKKLPVEPQSFYCVKCKSSKNQVPKKCIKTKNGRHALRAKCNDCGTKLTKFCSKEDHDSMKKLLESLRKSVKKSLRKSH